MIKYIKTHKVVVSLILIIAYLLWKSSSLSINPIRRTSNNDYAVAGRSGATALGAPEMTKNFGRTTMPIDTEEPPTSGIDNRMVVKNSNISLVVKDVRQTVDQILDQTVQIGGYMVSSNISRPQETPFATLVIRIPSDQIKQTLDSFRGMAIKVTSENLSGHDVTDQYLDINTRLLRLHKTQAKFEELLDQAVKFQDILTAQREILNLQDQIDNLIGRQKYLEQTAKLAKVTVYLSTDELALPYAPDSNFRPAVVFKLAVRSLVKTLRGLVSNLIWVGVYAVIWIPALLLFYIARRWWIIRQKRQVKKTNLN